MCFVVLVFWFVLLLKEFKFRRREVKQCAYKNLKRNRRESGILAIIKLSFPLKTIEKFQQPLIFSWLKFNE